MMNDIVKVVLVLALAGGAVVSSVGAERRPMALMVFFDGGRADCLRNAKCPNLKRLIAGTWASGYGCAWSDAARNLDDAPTYSYANHASILCGVPAQVHGLQFNSWVPLGRFRGQPSWLSLLSGRSVRTAAFHADRNDGDLIDGSAIETHVSTSHWSVVNGETAAIAVRRLSAADAPQASNLFFGSPDAEGHYFGYYPSSTEYLEAFDRCDRYLGQVLDAIRGRLTFDEEDWMIVFTTDHGGKGVRHGPDTGHCHTVPLLVVSRHVKSGILEGTPRTYDLVPTLLDHFGLKPTSEMIGRVLGDRVRPVEAPSPERDRVLSESFDRPLRHLFFVKSDFVGLALSGYTNNISIVGGRGVIHGRDEPCSFWTHGLGRAFKGPFAVSWWMLDSGVAYDDNPPVCGNRNNHDDYVAEYGCPAPGFTVFLKSPSDPGEKGITLEYLDGTDSVRRLGAFTSCVGKWTFYAIVNRGDGVVVFYQGRPDGKLNWIADRAPGAKLHSGLELAYGQDGTAEHHIGFDGAFDEIKIWSRALTTEEVDSVFSCELATGVGNLEERK